MRDGASADLPRLLAALDDDSLDSEPVLFDLTREDRAEALRVLLAGPRPPLSKQDRLLGQVRELVKSRNAGERLESAVLDAQAAAHLEEHGRDTYGNWVYYPWRRALVRVLPRAEFVELRTSRNRYKLTLEEQERLSGATLGIVGLSAGHAIALCLALERVGGTLRLADFDAIELSNMNRVACGLPALGTNKAVLTARQLYEIDPYLRISVFAEGVTPDNLEAFIGGEPKLDLLIEECDDLYMKVRLREEARARGVPVLMETNDRGLLDVERFDLEPTRPVFHGLLAGSRSEDLKGLDTEGKTPFLLRLLGDMSPRLAASLIEIDKTITGWPQLASGNMLGGAVVTDTARRILLGEHTSSGRKRVDLEALVTNTGDPARLAPAPPRAPAVPLPELPGVAPSPKGALPSRDEVEWLVQNAALAPSGGNGQPWRFVWRKGRALDCYLDRERSGSFLDFERSASYLALGAAAENAVLAAGGLHRTAGIDVFPESSEPDLVFRLVLGEPTSAVAEHALAPHIAARSTNRRLGQRCALEPGHGQTLIDAACEHSAELRLVTDPQTLSEVGGMLGAVDRFRFLCEHLHTSMLSELRWSAEEAASTGDGIDISTLELDEVGMAGLRLLANAKTSSFLRKLERGSGLEKPARRSVAAASAVAVLSVDGQDARAYFRAGRAVQRVWLWATRLGLGFQPLSVAPYLFARLTRGEGAGFSEREIANLGALRERYERVFPAAPGRADALLFRLAHAEAPSARALRRPIGTVLTVS